MQNFPLDQELQKSTLSLRKPGGDASADWWDSWLTVVFWPPVKLPKKRSSDDGTRLKIGGEGGSWRQLKQKLLQKQEQDW